MARRPALSPRESRAVAAAYYRAILAGRSMKVAARRCGVGVSTLREHGQLWPCHLDRLARSTTLRTWERERLQQLLRRQQ